MVAFLMLFVLHSVIICSAHVDLDQYTTRVVQLDAISESPSPSTGCPSQVLGIFLEYYWNIFVILLESNGIFLEYLWNLFRISLESLWNLLGIFLESLWNLFGSSLTYLGDWI